MTTQPTLAKSIVTAIDALADLDRPALEALLAVRLQHADGVAEDLRYAEAWLPEGPFSRVQYREPNAEQDQDWRLAVLEVRAGVDVRFEAFAGLIPAVAHPGFDPRVPPEGVTFYTLEAAGRTTYLEFGSKSKRLKSVSFHRKLAVA